MAFSTGILGLGLGPCCGPGLRGVCVESSTSTSSRELEPSLSHDSRNQLSTATSGLSELKTAKLERQHVSTRRLHISTQHIRSLNALIYPGAWTDTSDTCTGISRCRMETARAGLDDFPRAPPASTLRRRPARLQALGMNR